MHYRTYECADCLVSVSRTGDTERLPTCLRCRIQMRPVDAD
ncbi:hypothetical protein SAMN04487948_101377 [Halogranum amylolyticum]|uniref:Uncharacterized protein n=1 Tax=Halogranum amylolyticum TaxID=660520 RepID=A0A1H8N8I0_9EURY|nr:hypothetical protein [Halogranum amylolyticum]SEO25769.1 hypothetical protein SAMN04487948_101377 [Halogranum amylolyticum]